MYRMLIVRKMPDPTSSKADRMRKGHVNWDRLSTKGLKGNVVENQTQSGS